MDIIFKDTPNGEQACSFNNVRLHSFYNPSKEAERFAETAECQFSPSFILVTEPALSYCVPFLKKRFPNAKLFCIRFTKGFEQFNSKWNKVFHAESNDGTPNKNLSEEIFSTMGEEGIASCLFLSWKASDQAFPETSNYAWDQIKKAVLKSRSWNQEFFCHKMDKKCPPLFSFHEENRNHKQGNQRHIDLCKRSKFIFFH